MVGLGWTVIDSLGIASIILKWVITSVFMHDFWDHVLYSRTFTCQGNLCLWNTLCPPTPTCTYTYTTFPSCKFNLVFMRIIYRKVKPQERASWLRRKAWIPLTTQLSLQSKPTMWGIKSKVNIFSSGLASYQGIFHVINNKNSGYC